MKNQNNSTSEKTINELSTDRLYFDALIDNNNEFNDFLNASLGQDGDSISSENLTNSNSSSVNFNNFTLDTNSIQFQENAFIASNVLTPNTIDNIITTPSFNLNMRPPANKAGPRYKSKKNLETLMNELDASKHEAITSFIKRCGRDCKEKPEQLKSFWESGTTPSMRDIFISLNDDLRREILLTLCSSRKSLLISAITESLSGHEFECESLSEAIDYFKRAASSQNINFIHHVWANSLLPLLEKVDNKSLAIDITQQNSLKKSLQVIKKQSPFSFSIILEHPLTLKIFPDLSNTSSTKKTTNKRKNNSPGNAESATKKARKAKATSSELVSSSDDFSVQTHLVTNEIVSPNTVTGLNSHSNNFVNSNLTEHNDITDVIQPIFLGNPYPSPAPLNAYPAIQLPYPPSPYPFQTPEGIYDLLNENVEAYDLANNSIASPLSTPRMPSTPADEVFLTAIETNNIGMPSTPSNEVFLTEIETNNIVMQTVNNTFIGFENNIVNPFVQSQNSSTYLPVPIATTVPSIGLSLPALSGMTMPPAEVVSASLGDTTILFNKGRIFGVSTFVDIRLSPFYLISTSYSDQPSDQPA